MKRNPCENLNHRRTDAPVRFCPQCGKIVNEQVSLKHCGEVSHDKSRRSGYQF